MTLDRVAARTPDGSTLFNNLSLTFGRERTGVVGRNGAGKTTLLRRIAGLAEPAEVAVARVGRIGWLDPNRATASLSGGEQTRLRLAALLLAQPDLLVLDEPTNHLDLESIAAVEAALRAQGGALVVVSHDADFLEAIGVGRRVVLRPCG